MNKLLKPGRIIFAIGVIALAILCFISKDFIVGRPPGWQTSAHPLLGYISGALLIITALAILLQKKALIASMLIAILILLLSVFRHIPHFMADWLNAYKAMALFGGALIVAASFMDDQFNENSRNVFVVTGAILITIFFVAGGYAHFKFADFVKDFIPAYIPFHGFFTYFCGICLIAGGIGLLIPKIRYWAALLSAIMISGWFLLLHIPRFANNINDASDRTGLCESFTFAGILFTLAAICSNNNLPKSSLK
jgi:uncharacterized membrane protein